MLVKKYLNFFNPGGGKKIFFLSAFSVVVIFTVTQYFMEVKKSQAATACANATVRVVARDHGGAVIPGIAYQILEETINSDGEIRPGRAVASGKIDAILGAGKSIFSPAAGSYAVKMYDKNSSYGAFYFYGQLTLACGEEKTFTGNLSGLQIEFRDANGALRKNASFTLSLQAYDANDEPIKQKGATIATLNSDVSSQKLIYLADSGHTVDRRPINYVFSSPGYGGSEFVVYNISLVDGQTKEINYFFSDLMIKFKDKNNNVLPAGTRVEFLTQKSDITGRVAADKLIKVLSIDSDGYILFEYPAGTYFARIKKASGEYYNFTDIKIADRARTSLTLNLPDSATEQAVCTNNSNLKVVARNAFGNYITGIKFELYEKVLNANNLPAAGKLIVKGATDRLGNGSVSLKPNSGQAYMLKMYDKNAGAGAFWFYEDIKFTCGENKYISKNLSSLSLTVRDTGGNLLKDFSFSLYLQKKDIDNNLLKIKNYLVANIKTNANGQATVYVTGGNPTEYQDTARYLISLKYGSGLVFDKPDINITAGADTEVNYAISGLSLTLEDAEKNRLIKGTNVDIYEQKIDQNKKNVLGQRVTKLSLNDSGQGVVALPVGDYALSLKDKGGNLMNFWDIRIENGLLNSHIFTVPLLRVYAVDGAGKSLSKAAIYVYSLTKNSEGLYKKNKNIYKTAITDLNYADIFLATGQYLVTVKQGTSEFGTTALINDSSLKKVYLSTKSENLVKAESVYKIAAASPGRAAGVKIFSAMTASALTNRLKGYILLQVESRGEAWYVGLQDKKRYYLKDGPSSFEIIKSFGQGIKNSDLNKIPVGVISKNGEADCDHDGLSDALEAAIGTQACSLDSDGDGYADGIEVLNNYNPLGPGKLIIDERLANRLSGGIFLQVESGGQAWYINPKDKKRYYLKDGSDAYKLMKYLSLGITNADLNLIDKAD